MSYFVLTYSIHYFWNLSPLFDVHPIFLVSLMTLLKEHSDHYCIAMSLKSIFKESENRAANTNILNQVLIFSDSILLRFSQMESLALGHDIDSLRKECDQKDATIKELSTYLRSSEVMSSKVKKFTNLALSQFYCLLFFLLFMASFLRSPESCGTRRYHSP